MANRNQEQKKRVCIQVALCDEFVFLSVATSSSAASRPIVSKSREMSGASEKPSFRMNLEASSFGRSFSVSSVIKGCILWRVEGRAAGKLDA